MDPELLLRVGKPEKYGHLLLAVAYDIGPDNTGLVLEYSPNTTIRFVCCALDSVGQPSGSNIIIPQPISPILQHSK